MVLYARVYTDFERVRLQLVDSERAADSGSVAVRLPDLSALEAQPIAIVARVRNHAEQPRTMRLSVDGSEEARFTVSGGGQVRLDTSVDAGRLETGQVLRLDAGDGGWSLEHLELANAHGYSRGLFAFVIAPAAATDYAAPHGLFVVLSFVVMALLFFVPRQIAGTSSRRAHTALVVIVSILFAAALISPVVSSYRILFSLHTFLLCALAMTVPALRALLFPASFRARAWHRWGQGLSAGRRLLDNERLRHRVFYVIATAGLLAYAWLLVANAVYNVGGADSSGYLTSARWLSEGRVGEPVEALEHLDLPTDAVYYREPLGTMRGREPGTFAPYYPPGLPVHMMTAAWIGGWETYPFLVSPVAAVVGVLLMYLLAMEVGLPRAYSAAAAIMLGVGATYVFVGLSPMSDVVSTAWAIFAVLAAFKSNRSDAWALAAGAAFGIAVAIRPANALLLMPLALALPPAPRAWFRFVLGGAPVGLLLFGYNIAAYGAPLATGYGTHLSSDMSLSNFPVRFRHYTFWIASTLSPLVPLGWVLFIGDRKARSRLRLILTVWFLSYFLFHCFYQHYDQWWYTRFLLPAFPALILATMLFVRDATASRTWWLRSSVLAAVLLTVVWFGVDKIQRLEVLWRAEEEAVYRESVEWIEQNLPEKTAVLSAQVSGAVHYYSDRITIRWEVLDDLTLSQVREHLDAKGYGLAAALFPLEVESVRQRFDLRWRQIGSQGKVTFWVIDEER